jgi:hypothetical protein
VTILFTPPINNLLGAGTSVDVFSDITLPQPPTAFWAVRASLNDSITAIFTTVQRASDGFQATGFFWQESTDVLWDLQRARWPIDGQTVHVEATLDAHPAFTDVGQHAYQWSNTTGLGTQIQSKATGGGGGLTPDQAAQLARIEANQLTNTPVQQAINLLAQIPTLDQWRSSLGLFTLRGRGTIAPPVFSGFSLAVGIWFRSVNAPPSLSVRDGFIQTYLERIGQFVVLTNAIAGFAGIPLEFYELRTQSAAWIFKQRDFAQIGYDVLDGCSVDCQWLTAATP